MPVLTVPAHPRSLKKLRAFVKEGAQAAGLDRKATYAVQLAVDEASSNIIEHGYGGQSGHITCEWRITEWGLEIVILDNGLPFDPTQAPPPDLSSELESRQAGGLGIYLMRQMVDEVNYVQTPTGNRLTLRKHKGCNP